MTSPEQAAAPLDPLAVCEGKFNEAARLMIKGDEKLPIMRGSEVALFFYRNPSADRYSLLHRPAAGIEMMTTDLAFWIREVTVTGSGAERRLSQQDYAIKKSGNIAEVALLFGVPLVLSDQEFDPGFVDMSEIPSDFESSVPVRELTDIETEELLLNLRMGMPIVG